MFTVNSNTIGVILMKKVLDKTMKDVDDLLRYSFSLFMGIWCSVLLFIWVAQLW